jgi:hypothetical protein
MPLCYPAGDGELGYIYIYMKSLEKNSKEWLQHREINKKIENCLKSINLVLRFLVNHLVFVNVLKFKFH